MSNEEFKEMRKNESLNESIRATDFQENLKSDANSRNIPLPVVRHIKRRVVRILRIFLFH